MKIDRNSTKYNKVMNSHALDVPLGLLPEAIAKREKENKSTIWHTTFIVAVFLIMFLAFFLGAEHFDKNDPVLVYGLIILFSISMLLFLAYMTWDDWLENRIYKDIVPQIGNWQQFRETYHLQCRREYCCGEQHEHEKGNCRCYQVICGFYAHTAQTGKEEVEEFIELGRGGSRALAIKRAKMRIDNWRAEDKIERLYAEQFETFVLRKLREQAANQKNIQVLVD
ncbi:hypothetical protein [Cardiobacterium valvarum]|uniref:hypothetical protein n=1 Tax=Cardiobacterium valvarum TaxID=194702 RepID=UPI0035E4D6A4